MFLQHILFEIHSISDEFLIKLNVCFLDKNLISYCYIVILKFDRQNNIIEYKAEWHNKKLSSIYSIFSAGIYII